MSPTIMALRNPLTHNETLLVIQFIIILAASSLGALLGVLWKGHRIERVGGDLDVAFRDGQKSGYERGRHDFGGVISGTRIDSPRPAEIDAAATESPIGSHGYMLVPYEPVPDYVPDTWLQEQLAKGDRWLSVEMEKQMKWRNKVPRMPVSA